MKIALLGTGFGRAHAAVYAAREDIDEVVVFGRTPEKLQKIADGFGFATSTDLDALLEDPSVDLVDICLPTDLHAQTAVRAMEAGKDVLIELPLALDMADAQLVVEVQQRTGRQAFVDMFSRFNPADQHLRAAVQDGRYGKLKSLAISVRSALLWEGYDLGLDSIVIDMLHGDLDVAVQILGMPLHTTAHGVPGPGRGSAAEVLLTYPEAITTVSGSTLMPEPYQVRGETRATFENGMLEMTYTFGYDGRPTTMLTEFTDRGERRIDLPAADPYSAMIDHVLSCLRGQATNTVSPASALDALRLTLDIHDRINHHR